jgi:alkanesulfonate monooxygenase SsuD/methylene tetrahydromethanopterin reductase-like flavin-dependent oxidoreductase (luciferase family)
VERARFLDEAGFTALFFADVLGVYDVYRQSPDPAIEGAVDFPLNDPFMVIPAMLAASKNLSFAVTASTTYEHPSPSPAVSAPGSSVERANRLERGDILPAECCAQRPAGSVAS